MESNLLALISGISLAAACGFRVFLPLLILSLAARGGHLTPAADFAWVASTPALICLAVATILEISAYFVPWLDHLLDTIAVPAAVVAGIMASATLLGEIDPWLRWTLAVIAGGGAAGATQAMTIGGRGISSVTTAGLGNPLFSLLEAVTSAIITIFAIFLPAFAVIAAISLIFWWKQKNVSQPVQTPANPSEGNGS